MKEAPTVSVIMPAYNTEKYIKSAIGSVLGQTFSDLELIICDDGSTDSTGKICDEIAASDSRVRVIRRENGGVSAARNSGLEIARGKYLYFMDSDDEINADLLSDCVKASEETDCDVVVFGFKRIFLKGEAKGRGCIDYLPEVEGLRDFRWIKENFLHHLKYVPNHVCTKFYRRSAVQGIKFEKIRIAEDGCFNFDLLDKGIESIYYINKVYYNYYERQNSLMTSYNADYFDNNIFLIRKISALADKWEVGESVKGFLAFKRVENAIGEYSNLIFSDKSVSDKEIVGRMKAIFENREMAASVKMVKVKEFKWLSLRICYALSKMGLYRAALVFLRMYTGLLRMKTAVRGEV